MGKHQPALLGGLFIGVLSSLPFVGGLNLCCCLWVIVGGVLVTYLQQQNRPTPVETGEVVVGGLLAGVIGAIISSSAFLLLYGVGGNAVQDSVRQAFEQNPDMPPQARAVIERFANPRALGALLFALNLPMYAVFGMLGALLGLPFFRKKTPPQAPPPFQPPMQPPTMG